MNLMGTVFISYSHDDADHVTRVLNLSNRLRADGIDCVLDQYETSPASGWPRWMNKEIANAQFVLMICTENYLKRLDGEEQSGVGLGAMWEGNLIYQHIYDSGSTNSKFIPVLMRDTDKRFIPTPVRGVSYYAARNDEGYFDLRDRLLNRPRAEKPPLGRTPPMPKKQVKTNVAMFVSSPIDIDLWNEARWRATIFAEGHDYMPLLGLAFEDEAKGIQIFKEWRERLGGRDEEEELRVSIIEGDIEGQDPGYTVHVGPNPEILVKRMGELGLDVDEHLLTMVSRLNRMNPRPDSTGLAHFKGLCARQDSYLLSPAWISPDQEQFKVIPGPAILKRVIHFRDVADIGEHDVDRVVLVPPDA